MEDRERVATEPVGRRAFIRTGVVAGLAAGVVGANVKAADAAEPGESSPGVSSARALAALPATNRQEELELDVELSVAEQTYVIGVIQQTGRLRLKMRLTSVVSTTRVPTAAIEITGY